MAAGEGVSVGSIFGRLGYRFDASGSQQFDQTRQKHEQETQKPIVQGLGFEVDDRALKAYQAELDKVRARTTKRDEFKAKLGADFDSRAFRQYEAELRKAEREAQRMQAQQLKLAASADTSTRGFDKGSASVDAFARTLRGLFDQSAQITKIGVALQAVSAAGAGLGGIVAGLAPLAGGLAAYPALASAAAQGTGVLKLATNGLADSLGAAQEASKGAHAAAFEAYRGGSEEAKKYRDELEKLNKPQQTFVRSLVEQMPILKQLREDASQGLDSAAEGVEAASKNVGVLRPIVRETSEAIGGLVKRAGELVGSKGFGRDLQTQGERNVVWIERAGDVGLNLADALRHVTLAAGPLVDWLTKGAVRFSDLIDKQARAGRESGTLAKFFEQTQLQMSRVFRIAGDVATALVNIGKQAYPLGNDLLKAITKNAEKFKDWTESAKGKNDIRDYFERARPAIDEVGELIVTAAKMFARLGNGDQVAPLLKTIRTELLPVLEKVVDSTTRSFGPAFLEAVKQALILFSNIAGSSGPLVEFTKLLGRILEGINKVIDRVPGIGTALSAIVALGGIAKALQLAAALTGVSKLISLLKVAKTEAAVTGAATGAAGAAGAAGAGAAGAGAGAAASRSGRATQTLGRAGLVGIAAATIAEIDPFTDKDFDSKVNSVKRLQRAIDDLKESGNKAAALKFEKAFDGLTNKDGVIKGTADQLAKLAEGAGKVADAAKEMAGPIAGSVGEMRRSFHSLATNAGADMDDILKVVRRNMNRIRDRLGTDSDEGRKAVAENFRSAAGAIKRQMDRGEIATKDGMRAIRGYLAQELQTYGLSLSQAKNVAKGNSNTGATYGDVDNNLGREGGSSAINKAGGGWIGAPGMVGHDTVPAMLAPGEAVLNRHQQGVIEGLLGGGFLDQLFANVQTPHYMARGGIVPVPGFPGERAASSILDEIAMVTRRFGLILTDAYGQGHKSPGHTKFGTAADFAGPDRSMDAAVKALVAAGYLVGYDGRFGSKAWPGHGPSTVAGGNAHLHVEFGSKGGGLAVDVPTIKVPSIKGGGDIGRAVQAALGMAASGAQGLLQNSALSALSTPVAGGSGAGASSAQVRRWVASGLRLAGIPASGGNVSTVAGRAMQESGGNPRAQNNWDSNAKAGNPSKGLLQTIMSTFRRYMVPGHGDVWNPVDNTAAAVRYMMARYGHLVGAGPGGYARGGVVGAVRRFAKGGFVGAVQRFAGGGRPKPPKLPTIGALGGGGGSTLSIRALRSAQGDHIGDYDSELGDLEDDRKTYEQTDRRYGQSVETLVDPDTGQLNQAQIEKRAGELGRLQRIRERIARRLKHLAEIARRVIKTYTTIIGRLTRSLKHAKKKERPGIRASIEHYTGARGEWRDKLHDLGFDITDAELDVGDIIKEGNELRGTVAEPGAAPSSDSSDTAASSDGTVGITPDQQAQLDQVGRLQEIVALGDFLNASALKTLQVFDPSKVGQAGVGGAPSQGVPPAGFGAGAGTVGGGTLSGGAAAAGGVTINFQSYVPPSPQQAQELAGYVVKGLSGQGAVPATNVLMGV